MSNNDNPFATHIEQLSEIRKRILDLSDSTQCGGHMSDELESIARAVSLVAVALNGDIEGGQS